MVQQEKEVHCLAKQVSEVGEEDKSRALGVRGFAACLAWLAVTPSELTAATNSRLETSELEDARRMGSPGPGHRRCKPGASAANSENSAKSQPEFKDSWFESTLGLHQCQTD